MSRNGSKAIIVTFVVGILYYFSTLERVRLGYFDSGTWVAINGILFAAFIGLIAGTFVVKIVGKR